MSSIPKLYGFGSACVDYRIHIPDMGKNYTDKVMADDIVELGGGACANCLVQAARLGGDCTYLGKLGQDPQSDAIKKLLSDEKVSIELQKAGKSTLSPMNIAVYKGVENIRLGGYLLPNSLGSITCEEAAKLAAKMEEGSSVMVEIGEIPLKSVLIFMKVAAKKDIRIFVDVDLDPVKQCRAPFELFEEILTYADVIIPNYNAVRDLYKVNNRSYLAAHLSVKLKKTVIVTAGDRGVYYCENGNGAKHILADDIKVNDTVGAGDSFHGSLMYAMAIGCDIEESIRFAIKCSQLTCMGYGSRASMPYMPEVRSYLL